jgi:single-stranded-DNA-specific exonuclease
MEEDFFISLSEAADKLVNSQGIIRIVTHNDCDGITSAAILSKALKRLEKKFVLSFVKNLTPEVLREIALEDYKTIVLTDLGSNSLEQINSILNEKDVFILDHHQVQNFNFKGTIVNPLLHGVDGETGISAAGVVYLLTKLMDSKNKENAYIALIGAIGDMQERRGFSGLNAKILEDAKHQIEIKTGLRIFGSQTRALHKALEYSTDIFIPGVTGDERGSINFLQNLDIPLQDKNGKYRKLVNLTTDEMKILVSAIILERIKTEKNAEDILGQVYLLKSENNEDITRDLKEFSTLLNATARMNQPSIGWAVCLNDKKMKERATEVLSNYKVEIINALNWFHKNRNSEKIIESNNLVIINAEEYVKDTMIGTIASIISKSNIYKSDIVLVAMAHTIDGFTKISARVVGNNPDINLRSILQQIIQKIGGETGGHDNAAGAVILQEKDDEFIQEVKSYLANLEQIA